MSCRREIALQLHHRDLLSVSFSLVHANSLIGSLPIRRRLASQIDRDPDPPTEIKFFFFLQSFGGTVDPKCSPSHFSGTEGLKAAFETRALVSAKDALEGRFMAS